MKKIIATALRITESDRVTAFLLIVVVVAILIIISSCMPAVQNDGSPGEPPGIRISNSVINSEILSREVDSEAGVVCWYFRSAVAGYGGLSCLPISETNLR